MNSEMLEKFMHSAPVNIFFKDTKCRYCFASEVCELVVAGEDGTILGKTDLEIQRNPELGRMYYEDDKKILAMGEGSEYISEFSTGDRKTLYYEIKKSAVRDERNCIIGITGIVADVTERVLLEKKVEELSIIDSLTRVYNRNYLKYQLEEEKKKMKFPFTVIMSDCNYLKQVNDQYGHEYGDIMLKMIANTLKEELPEECTVIRMGGDEFMILCNGISEEKAIGFMNSIRTNLKKKSKERIPLSLAMGSYTIQNGSFSIEDVYHEADRRMYKNKKKLKHNNESLPVSTVCDYASLTAEAIMESYECDIAFYTEKQAKMRIYEQMIENDFEKALNNQEFLVYYQPKVDLATEKVIGAEALVRWKKPDGTVVSPGEFIPVYEKNGQIEKLDEYVFQKVCQLQKRKLDEREKLLSISVNLSRSSILRDGIAERYIKIAEENEIPISCVPLELTESVAIYGKRIHGTTEQLVNAGFKLHMDDFGSGYSSMICLNQLPFSTLKIDKSLVVHICEPKGKTLVEQIIMLSKLLNMEEVAEGVETIEQIEELRKMKCDVIQGFYYAKPMPENEFIEYVKVNRLR